MFAKLYNTQVGQVLIKLDEGPKEVPEVRFYFKPQGMGVCSVAYTFDKTEQGYMDCEKLFHESNELQAEAIAIDALEKSN